MRRRPPGNPPFGLTRWIMHSAESADEPRPVTCVACGCLCDDLSLGPDGEILGGCAHARWWFDFHRDNRPASGALLGDRPVSLDTAVAEAAAILNASRFPLVLGGQALCVDGQRALVALADCLGAALDAGGAAEDATIFFPQAGVSSCTWGEVVHRADLIVYWNVPLELNWWRHRELILDRIRATRQVETIHVGEDVPFDGWDEVETILAVRAHVRGVPADVPAATRALADRLRQARYAVILHHADHRVELALQMLARDLNESAHCRVVDLGAGLNSAGLAQVARWQTGYSRSIAFHRGYPLSCGREFSAELLLARGDCDAVVSVGSVANALSPSARSRFDEVHRVHISIGAEVQPQTPQVTLFTSTPSFDGAGVAFRSDGVSLPLWPVSSPSHPSPNVLLMRLAEALRAG